VKTPVWKDTAEVSEVFMMLHTTMELPDDGQEPFPENDFKKLHCHNMPLLLKRSWKFMKIHKHKISNKVIL